MAYQAHIVVPTDHERAEEVIDHISRMMAVSFDGYSRYEGSGGWESSDGLVTEDHARLVVDVPDDSRYDREMLLNYLEIEAEYVKSMLDQEAVLVELHEMEMELV